jgi:secondary thiamine-phosphate synthase enzyme
MPGATDFKATVPGWRTHGRFLPCVRLSRVAYIAKGAMYAPPMEDRALDTQLSLQSKITGGAEMKSHTEYLWFNTKKKREFINITGELERALEKARIQEGLVLASAMHITAGVYINDAEDGLIADITEWLEKLAPFREDYRHHRTGEDNGDAHLKNLLIGHQVLVPVTNGKLDLGPWQQVYYAEFDGQRRERVLIKVLGE